MAIGRTGGGRAGWQGSRSPVWAVAAAVAVVAAAVLGGAGTAKASEEKSLSPRQALSALPRPPLKAEEARLRWSQGVDVAVQPVKRGAQVQLAAVQRELAGQRAFERDPATRRAAAARLEPSEITALLQVEQAHAAVDPGRNIERLARSTRQEIEAQAKAVEEARLAAVAACSDEACRKAAELAAQKARAELLSRLLDQTAKRWELLKLRLDHFVSERQRLAERVATASSDPYVQRRAQRLLEDAWMTVAELADEVEKETQLAASLAQ